MRGMNGPFSHEALAAIAGEELITDVEHQAAQAPGPAPEALATVTRIFAPSVRHLAAKRRSTPVLADAA